MCIVILVYTELTFRHLIYNKTKQNLLQSLIDKNINVGVKHNFKMLKEY